MSESEITKVSISNLTTEHLDIFVKTLSKVLSTNLAERTFSQVIDGLPTCDVYDKYGECRREDIDAHEEPCPDSVEAFKRFRADFSPNTLEIDSKVGGSSTYHLFDRVYSHHARRYKPIRVVP